MRAHYVWYFAATALVWGTEGNVLAQGNPEGIAEPVLIAHNDAERDLLEIHDAYLAQFKPLFLRAAKAWWVANTTGSDEAYAEKKAAETALVELHSDKARFAKLKSLKADGLIADRKLARILDVMYRAHLPGQADPELQKKIVNIENEVEQIFNTHRSEVDGKALSENDVRKILSESPDSALAEKAWKGYMAVGAKVEDRLKRVVAMRNELARKLGFRNFWAMKMSLSEIDGDELVKLFDELDRLTREPFATLKKEIDAAMAARFKLTPDQLRPWHFGDLFFQEAPAIQKVNLDDVFKGQDPLALTRKYYESLGLEVSDIIARSDLYEKPGKSPHAFSTDLDRAGDVRTLCNLKDNAYWMDTLLHELGHAVYDKYIDASEVPFVLHEAAHSITTEGYAMQMGAMCKNEEWLVKVRGIDPVKQADVLVSAREKLRAEKLIFSRWGQVIVRFEKGMYENPDQDLGKLWWDLKARYQLLPPPESASRPDYAAKIHVVAAPVYYHSYVMGDLFACQVQDRIADMLGIADPTKTCFYGRPEAGEFFRKHVFGPGNLYSWNELTRRATGEPLTAKYFAEQYVK